MTKAATPDQNDAADSHERHAMVLLLRLMPAA